MNERIRELSYEAQRYALELSGTDMAKLHELWEEKFALLIVEECIDVVDVGGEFVSRPKMVERLKAHFGVE